LVLELFSKVSPGRRSVLECRAFFLLDVFEELAFRQAVAHFLRPVTLDAILAEGSLDHPAVAPGVLTVVVTVEFMVGKHGADAVLGLPDSTGLSAAVHELPAIFPGQGNRLQKMVEFVISQKHHIRLIEYGSYPERRGLP
jgi:hypothetical protein